MTPEVKNRIEQIRHGNVPDGYKKGKIGIIPTEWDEIPFSTLFTSTSQYTDDLAQYPLYSLTIEDGITAKTERYERSHLVKKENSYKVVRPNDYAYNPMNIRFGAVARHKGDIPVAVSGYYDIFAAVYKSDLAFMDSFLTCAPMITYYNKVSTGSLIEKQRVHFSDFMEFSLALPPIKERKKIAEILTTQDKVIELKEKRLAEKHRQKKYLMQQLLTSKKRLPGFDEEWKTAPIGKFLESRNTKQMPSDEAPLMAFIAGEGVTSKGDRYDRSHLVKEDTKKYKRTELNDFIYSSNNLDVGSIGLNKYGTAVISVVYEIFKAKEKVVPVVISEIIQLPRNLHHILSYRQGAFYGQYRIFAEDFLSVPIKVPCYEEQLAIGVVLDAADKEIDLLSQELEQEKQKKKALMQLLLTGIVRV